MQYNHGINWIRKQLKEVELQFPIINPVPIILIADTTFFGRNNGLCIFYASNIKKVVTREYIKTETAWIYNKMRSDIEDRGFQIMAVVIDGRKGIKEVFSDLPVQMCQFHQKMILRRYLTLQPRLEPAKELKQLCQNLCNDTETSFKKKFQKWNMKWAEFLKERTYYENGKWAYTHRKLRSAKRSLQTNIPYLFTYQKYTEFDIPNTTNSVESINAKLKGLTRIHSGFKSQLKCKIIDEILFK